MNRLAIFGVLLLGCAGSRARAPVAAKASTRAHAATRALVVGDLSYAWCGMLRIPTPPPELVEASRHFSRAVTDARAGRREDAGRDYLRGARAIGQGEARADPDVVYNRRVAYANGINTWLSLGLVEQAREALLVAARVDAELADELRQAAARLPAPMRCTPP